MGRALRPLARGHRRRRHRVVTAFSGRKFPQRAYGGVWAGQLRWGPLTHHRVLQVLKNPAYAGAYVHGRVTIRTRVDADGNVRTALSYSAWRASHRSDPGSADRP